ncbi:MAG: hypothetical protein LBH76_07320, partial [Propionibacteriaceae bacterium]|nr:hypothetical protein [Propionibacteriaceae bacterium]
EGRLGQALADFADVAGAGDADADAMKDVMSNGGYCADPSVMQGVDLFIDLRDSGAFVDNVAGMNAPDAPVAVSMTQPVLAGEAKVGATLSVSAVVTPADADVGRDLVVKVTVAAEGFAPVVKYTNRVIVTPSASQT